MKLPEESWPALGHGASEWQSGAQNPVPRLPVLWAALIRVAPGNWFLPTLREARGAAGTRTSSGWAAVLQAGSQGSLCPTTATGGSARPDQFGSAFQMHP